MKIDNQICNLLYHWTKRRTWKSKRKSPSSFQISLALKKKSMSSNKDFLPSTSPISSICAIEIGAILFLFMVNCYKSSFQECITAIERTRNQPPYCLLQLQEKQEKMAFRLPRSGCLRTPLTLPRSLYGWTYADVRTKIFRINGLPNLLTHGAPRAPLGNDEKKLGIKYL